MSSFRDALIGDHRVTFVVTNELLLAGALAELGAEHLTYGVVGAVEWFQRTGEVLPGVEVKEADDEHES